MHKRFIITLTADDKFTPVLEHLLSAVNEENLFVFSDTEGEDYEVDTIGEAQLKVEDSHD